MDDLSDIHPVDLFGGRDVDDPNIGPLSHERVLAGPVGNRGEGDAVRLESGRGIDGISAEIDLSLQGSEFRFVDHHALEARVEYVKPRSRIG